MKPANRRTFLRPRPATASNSGSQLRIADPKSNQARTGFNRCGQDGGESGIRTRGTLRYTRFPVVHLRPLGHLSRKMAERVGFEPTVGNAYNRFRDCRLRPLGHLSAEMHSSEVDIHARLAARSPAKNCLSWALASSARTPPTTSNWWFNLGLHERSPTVPQNPPLGSAAP